MSAQDRDGEDQGPGSPGGSSGLPAEPTQAEADAAWRDIVENFGERALLDGPDGSDDTGGTPGGRGDDSDGSTAGGSDGGHGEPGTGAGTKQGQEQRRPPVVSPGLFRLAGTPAEPDERRTRRGGRDGSSDPEDHFVPPAPPPLPRPEPQRLVAWLGLFLAPSLLLASVIAGFDLPATVDGLLLLWFLGGFGFLVVTMPRGGSHGPDGPDGWDDGARL